MGGGVYRNCLLLAFKIEVRLESKPTIGTGLSEGSVGIRFGGWSTKYFLGRNPMTEKRSRMAWERVGGEESEYKEDKENIRKIKG